MTSTTRSPRGALRRLPRLRVPVRAEALIVLGTAGAALLLALMTKAHHVGSFPAVLRGAVSTLIVFGACGWALAIAVLPRAWGAFVPLLALPLGAIASGLLLTAFGLIRVPLDVSLWITLALGLASGLLALQRRRLQPRTRVSGDRRLLVAWLAVLTLLFCLALIPAWRVNSLTIYGQNPDSHQVAGIAVLFQHTAPTGTDTALPIDTVPSPWRFRYPIFYPLAGASALSRLDPIQVFPVMAALLVAITALGFGAFAVRCLNAPAHAGPLVAAVVGLTVNTLHVAWHPYWNQLWGLAMLPYVLLFGWCMLEHLDARCTLLCALATVMLALAYPLALPDPLLILVLLAIAYRRGPRLVRAIRSRSWIVSALALVVLAPAVAGAALKLEQGLSQFLSPHGGLWGGDVTTFTPIGEFVGTGGALVPGLLVLGVAFLGLLRLPRRVAWATAVGVLALCLIDLRFRTTSGGAYMDFKQLSFVGAVVVALAASSVAAMLGSASRALAAAGLVLAGAWSAAAVIQDRREILRTGPQVTDEMFQLRSWARRLPPRASVRIDIPPSGTQLWAVYMLGDHPVDSPTPLLYTTYAHASFGWRAEYSLSLRYQLNANPRVRRLVAPSGFAVDPPLFENAQFVLRKISWPARYSSVSDTSSTALVEP